MNRGSEFDIYLKGLAPGSPETFGFDLRSRQSTGRGLLYAYIQRRHVYILAPSLLKARSCWNTV